MFVSAKQLVTIISLICTVLLFPEAGQGQTKKVEKLNIPPNSLNFIALGDWGRYGDDHQLQVAAQMAKTAKEASVLFFISTGDNFYPKGVASTLDPHWHYSFEEIYKPFSLQREWYSVLGNHDYMGDPDAQVAYSKVSRRWEMPGRYFSKTFALPGGSGEKIQISFIDTNPLIPEFYSNAEYGPNVKTQDSTAQKQWLQQVLTEKAEGVKWNLVVGHHPLYTASDKRSEGYDTKAVRRSLKSLLDPNHVDAYLAGHDHSLQHLEPEGGVHHFISGSASEATQVGKLDYSKFSAMEYGFLLFSVSSKEMVVHAISHTGKVLYRTSLQKEPQDLGQK
ncbi:purple acid phosphatase family protein [Pontibacter qinzhouensis]|nr:tartrate-resistant acid phosphatase type 5 family protein [Pontibacter qinzhouensis]